MSINETIARLAEDFTANVLKALNSASLADLSSLAAGSSASRAGKEVGNGRAIATRGRRAAGRSPADARATLDVVVAALKNAPQGLRNDQLQKALSLTKNDLLRPIAIGLESKAIRKRGQRRGTTYFVA